VQGDRKDVETMIKKLAETVEERAIRVAEERYRQGRAEGRTEGRAEGSLAVLRELLCTVLRHRLGALPADLERRIAACTEVARLQHAVEQATTVGSADDVDV